MEEVESEKTMRYYSYRRISPHETRHQSVSLQAQRDVIEGYLAAHRAKLSGDFPDEKVSASVPLSERPHGKKLLEVVKDGNCAIVCSSLDRMFRDALDGEATLRDLRKQGVQVIFLREGADLERATGRLLIRLASAMAQFERETMIERKLAANQSRRVHGLAPAGTVPYGWRAVDAVIGADGRRTGGKLEADEAEQKVIQTIVDQRKRGKSLRAIADYLQEHGVVGREGGPIAHTMVAHILKTKRTRMSKASQASGQ